MISTIEPYSVLVRREVEPSARVAALIKRIVTIGVQKNRDAHALGLWHQVTPASFDCRAAARCTG